MPSCVQVKFGTCFTVSHYFSSCWPDSSTKMSMLVPTLGISTSEPTPVSPVVAERASLSDGCASER